MSVIKILTDDVSNKIAAGEVIARPASVVKELMENAIDAGADRVTVSIERAGAKSVSVVDNGKGMDPDDAVLCLEPHATSKIASAADINHIRTLGFRGEALPSIASVSRLTIKTRRADDLEGTEVTVHGGKMIECLPVGCAPGTEVRVRELFFNTPARKKFLKSPATEEKHIIETFMACSLPRPSVNVELIMDGDKTFSSPADDDLRARLRCFLGDSVATAMIPVSYEEAGVSVKGHIAKHGYTRRSRRDQRVFVNGRPVEAFAAYRGVRDGYGGLVPKGSYPPVVLFLSMDPSWVDVNVHPAKREARFGRERVVSSVIANAVRSALRATSTMPSAKGRSIAPVESLLKGLEVSYAPKVETPDLGLPSPPPRPTPAVEPERRSENEPRPEAPVTPASSSSGTDDTVSSGDVDEAAKPVFDGDALDILGFLDDTYVLAATESGLLVIDQHAAHERVLFERLLRQIRSDAPSQRLLIPITLELSRAETLFLEKNRARLEALGFEIESFGGETSLVQAVPEGISQENVGGFISDVLSELMDEASGSHDIDESAVAKAACKAAVKSHDRLSRKEVFALLQQMSECELPFSCPHGRPTMINISFKELEKRFGRR